MIFLYIDPGSGYSFLNIGGMLLAFLTGAFGLLLLFLKNIFVFIKKNKMVTGSLFFVVIALIIMGIFMIKPVTKFDKKVVVLGIDALSPEIMEPMMKAGRLPNFAHLATYGSYSRLATTNPAQSPVAWAALATGKNSGENGVFDFIVRDPKTYGLDLVFSKMKNGQPVAPLKEKGFWDYTSAHKVQTVVLGCPDTFPPHKIQGKMLSGMGVPDILGTQGTFTFYSSALEEGHDVGGHVIQVAKADEMSLYLIGPSVVNIDGTKRNSQTPFTLNLLGKDRATVEYQGKKIELVVGNWSDWQSVEFDLGFFKKVSGTYKMYLLSVEPVIKLYITPVNFDPRQPLFPISYPQSYARELVDKIGLYYTQGMPMDVWGLNEKRLSEDMFLQQVDDVWQERRKIFDLEFNQMHNGVLFAYFEQMDIVQHMFWRYRAPGHASYEANSIYSQEIERWYVKMDDFLGEVLKKIGSDDLLLVMSDHGFGAFQRAVHLNGWLLKHGYMVLKDPSVIAGRELLEDVDWNKTKAYAIGFGGIYINQKGREGQGIVQAGKDSAALKAEIAQGLKAWRDDKENLPVIKNVYNSQDVFHGRYAKDAPDLIVGFNMGYRSSWQTAMGAAPNALIEDNLKKWSGDHLFDPSLVPGVLFSSKKAYPHPTIYDITPTILKFIGYNAGEIKKCQFDGKVLF